MRTLIYRFLSLILFFAMLSLPVLPVNAQATPDEILDPIDIPKYVDPLVIPPVMPSIGKEPGIVEYSIATRQFEQQVLPSQGFEGNQDQSFPKTTVWGYGATNAPPPGTSQTTFHWPAYTIETRSNETVRVKWINDLVDKNGNYLPHLFAIDQTLHWANPAGPADSHGTDPNPYTGPVPITTHVHGAHVLPSSDGHPESWYLPAAKNIPEGYISRGTNYSSESSAKAGEAIYEYPNSQRAATLWYHDHAFGITRLNVQAGLAGFWLIRDSAEDGLNLPGPAPQEGDKPGTRYYEIPMSIQDRSFNQDGSIFFPNSRKFFDDFNGPFLPSENSDVHPIWNPEFLGNTMVVNGKTWPYLEVEPRLYRLRLLNGCNARTLILKIVCDPEGDRPAAAAIKFNLIGNEGGLLPNKPVLNMEQTLIGPGERKDVIVDFSSLKPGQEIYLINEGPDSPFNGAQQDPADPTTTGQVMKFIVVPKTSQGNAGQIPTTLPSNSKLENNVKDRFLTLNEITSKLDDSVPVAAMLGTAAEGPLNFDSPITENPALNSTENWDLINLTVDGHPIHLHLVQFQLVNRQEIDSDSYNEDQAAWLAGGKKGPMPSPTQYLKGSVIPPEPWETGWKDTVIALPGFVTRIQAKFDIGGEYVWHCHILDHEDNEMMRPYYVGSKPEP